MHQKYTKSNKKQTKTWTKWRKQQSKQGKNQVASRRRSKARTEVEERDYRRRRHQYAVLGTSTGGVEVLDVNLGSTLTQVGWGCFMLGVGVGLQRDNSACRGYEEKLGKMRN